MEWHSEDQKDGKGRVQLTFTATSEAELISRVLSFGKEARVVELDWLVED